MGQFFTSTHIYNSELLGREEFTDMFCKEMKKEGYVSCGDDESELSYILRFADNSKWVTITSEAYEQGNQQSQQDTGRIAKMLKTTCINTVVIDSDCAVLDLYDDSGKKADSLIMGRADDYFGDDIPKPCEKIWKSFLSNSSTWEQFTGICNVNEVFVEDSLSKLAGIIGMDSSNILFSAEDAQKDEQTFFLCFKKVNTEAPKKLTLNAAFRQVFGEALKPLGFVKIKSKYPYYVRMVNDELLHVITLIPKTSGLRGKKAFEVYGGAASVYRKELNFSDNPAYDTLWMCSNFKICIEALPIPQKRTDEEDRLLYKLMDFYYEIDNADSLMDSMQEAYKYSQQYLFPCIDNVTDIDKMIGFFFKHTSVPLVFGEKFEGLIFLKANNYYEVIKEKAIMYEEKYKIELELQNYGYNYGRSQEEFESMVRNREAYISRDIVPIKEALDSPELSKKYNKELERRKAANTEVLRSYGIKIDQNVFTDSQKATVKI